MEIEMVLVDGIVIFITSPIIIKIKNITEPIKIYKATGKRLSCNNNHVDIVSIIDTRD